MSYQRPWNSYRQISAHTASPGQLVLMLYDGALRFLEKSLVGFEMDDPMEFNQTINNNLLRAQSIISELSSTLNLEQGGELARTLRRLYSYMDDRLMESNLAKTPEGIRDTLRRLTILRDAWQEMLQRRTVESAHPSEARPLEVSSLCACG
jgi:flagellar protein FliS